MEYVRLALLNIAEDDYERKFFKARYNKGDELCDFLSDVVAAQHWNGVLPTALKVYLVPSPAKGDPRMDAVQDALKGVDLDTSAVLGEDTIPNAAYRVAKRIGAGGGVGTGVSVRASAVSPRVVSPRERFKALLVGHGYVVNEAILSVIAKSSALSSRLVVATEIADAYSLYVDASKVPHSETRAMVWKNDEIAIDGDIPYSGAQTAMFFHAFRKNLVPLVLKVPRDSKKVVSECAMYESLGADVPTGVYLVSVTRLTLRGSHRSGIGSDAGDVASLEEGILMPSYSCTLSHIPMLTPVSARAVIARMEPTLRFIATRGWMHGDVKPSNIFIDADGQPWLGDYGSSVAYADLDKYTGGTTQFQLLEVPYTSRLEFDLSGLGLSVLNALGLLPVDACPHEGWPSEAVNAALHRITDDSLQRKLRELLQLLG